MYTSEDTNSTIEIPSSSSVTTYFDINSIQNGFYLLKYIVAQRETVESYIGLFGHLLFIVLFKPEFTLYVVLKSILIAFDFDQTSRGAIFIVIAIFNKGIDEWNKWNKWIFHINFKY